ncbi:PREDICTED: C-type lectin domain family 4 member D-like [Hipposideros armiger]|uniref:C-type lectin domain family 4 member D-like n=1 Tax=Hipposideros armiger TaxID=186990 RepID=A0A8B7Q1F5_HIPAR|nr:PREDICTED: C-type lectin domain family 4 member D-like [Hipposideros armiger]
MKGSFLAPCVVCWHSEQHWSQGPVIKLEGGPYFQMMPWAIAIVFILLLGACFIASSLVTHHNFLHCKRSTSVFKLPGHYKKLICIREKSELKGTDRREHKRNFLISISIQIHNLV